MTEFHPRCEECDAQGQHGLAATHTIVAHLDSGPDPWWGKMLDWLCSVGDRHVEYTEEELNLMGATWNGRDWDLH